MIRPENNASVPMPMIDTAAANDPARRRDRHHVAVTDRRQRLDRPPHRDGIEVNTAGCSEPSSMNISEPEIVTVSNKRTAAR